MSRKRRVLLVGEYSGLATGYSVYAQNLLTGLHRTGDYELAELACYCGQDDPSVKEKPWRVYPNLPAPDRKREYDAKVANQFGEFTFDAVCLDFRPDVVLDFRDPWMYAFVERSPYRRLFHWLVQPTVDSAPYSEQWIATLTTADRVLTYTDWSREVLEREGGGLIDVFGVASPGADFEAFHPHNPLIARDAMGLESDVYIVGTVMRNQPRKLYPQLIDDFREFLRTLDKYTASKTYLYLHTSYPDKGWDLPRLIKNSGISNKILVTYKCRTCTAVFASFYADAATTCPGCGSMRCTLPNTANGVDTKTLGLIMNCFDVYVQYASNEGLGMPTVEAAACGVPVMATDYSAMSDVVRKLGGHPIKVDSMSMDPDVGAYRARPCGKDFARTLKAWIKLGDHQRWKMGRQAAEAAREHYSWDRNTATWIKAIESLSLRDWSETWDSPPQLHEIVNDLPAPASAWSNPEIVRWAITNVLGRPDLAGSYLAMRLTRDLNWGVRMGEPGRAYQNEDAVLGSSYGLTPFSVEKMLLDLAAERDNVNRAELARWERRSRC